MEFVTCKNGHTYDAEVFTVCPYCGDRNNVSIPQIYAQFGEPRLIDTGSTSSVYQLVPDRKNYAVKVIDCGISRERINAAENEIRIMEQLRGVKGTVPLIDWRKEERDGDVTYFLLMEYYQPLMKKLRDGNLSEREITRIGKELCTILTEMRKRGILHLDIQPKNVFFDHQDNCVIGDFGFALIMRHRGRDDYLRGTKAYMAPEVYHDRIYSERSEIYSLGVLLYTLYNGGKLPLTDRYSGEEATERRLQGEAFIDTCTDGHDTPDTLADCIGRACKYDPKERFASFEDFYDALTAIESKSAVYNNLIPDFGLSSDPFGIGLRKQNDTSKHPMYDQFMEYAAEDYATSCVMPWYPEPQKAAPSLSISEVRFSALFPRCFMKGDYSILEMYLYEDAYRNVVEEAIAWADSEIKESKSNYLRISEGGKVRILLECADRSVSIDGNNEVQMWHGKYLKFDFAVFLEENYPKRQVMFTATVYFDDVPATRLRFVAECNTYFQQKMEITRDDVLSVFMSYASQDRSRVATIIQGMKKARPDMDIFFDADKLRSGVDWESAIRAEIERRDMLFLCWSQAAKESVWVDREWRYALENKGLASIEPVPIEPPSRCPPPKELAAKSFNDRELLYTVYE